MDLARVAGSDVLFCNFAGDDGCGFGGGGSGVFRPDGTCTRLTNDAAVMIYETHPVG